MTGTLDRDTAESYARWFHALSDPNRVMIVHYLARQAQPVPAGAIVEHLGIGQSTVSHHLKILYTVRFVTRRRQGTSILYAINRGCEVGLPTATDVVLARLPPPAPAPDHEQRARPGRSAPAT